MKRTIAITLLLCLLTSMLTGCACEHVWNEATCTPDGTCQKCGEIESTALGHQWKAATCLEMETCDRCGETRGTFADHEVGEWVRVKDASGNKKPGILTLPCAVCGVEMDAIKGNALYDENGYRRTGYEFVDLLAWMCAFARDDGKGVWDSAVKEGIYNLTVFDFEDVMVILKNNDQYTTKSDFDHILVSQYIFKGKKSLEEQLENYYFMVAGAMFAIDPTLGDIEDYVVYVRDKYTKLISGLTYSSDEEDEYVFYNDVKFGFSVGYYTKGDSILVAFGADF